MRSSEVRSLGRLAGRALAGSARIGGEMHTAIANRTFAALGGIGAPARVMHDSIARTVYRAVELGLEAPARAGARAVARLAGPDAAPLSDSRAGGILLGVLNGGLGDRLAQEKDPLALELTVRRRGRDVALSAASLKAAFPDATSRLVVFVHGLCETEDAWRLVPTAAQEPPHRSYGSLLREELGYTPVYVRYNTGLHVSDNGRRLAQALEDVVRGWPVPVQEVALIGHSMGGLVSRSACHYAEAAGHPWPQHLRHVFCLGTPHLGAPLEKAANLAGWTLGHLPETQVFARVVNGRSAGIKDLRFGNLVEEDWCDCDPDEFLHDRCCEVPFLPSATYYFIGATLSRDRDAPAGMLLGDLLVRFPSASGHGRKRRIPFEIDHGRHLGGLNHFQLLNHPAVYEQIRHWLGRGSRLPAPVLSAGTGAAH